MHYIKKKYYLINKFDTKNINKLSKDTIVVFRKYNFNEKDEKTILKIKALCRKKKIKFN